MQKKLLVVLLFVCISFYSFLQTPAKKSLSTDDFASWNIISGKQISNNGKYVVYEQNPLKGDGQLFIKHGNHTEIIERAYKAQIGSENDVVVFNIKQPVDTLRKAKKNKLKKDNMPKDSLGIYLLKNDKLITFPKVKSFKMPKENTSWLAFLLEVGKEKKDSTRKSKEKQQGDDLMLFNIHNRDTIKLKNITEYFWAKKGSALVCVHKFLSISIISINDKDVCIVTIEKSDKPVFMGKTDNEEFYIRASASSQPLGVRETYKYINSHWK